LISLLFLFPHRLALAENNSHFGFQFLTSYDECLRLVKERFPSSPFLEHTQSDENGLVPIPALRFAAPLGEYAAVNELIFTPSTKQLYQIAHTVLLSKENDFPSVLIRFETILNKNYGSSKDGNEAVRKYEKDDPRYKWFTEHFLDRIWNTHGMKVELR